jgi:hypothetical protein
MQFDTLSISLLVMDRIQCGLLCWIAVDMYYLPIKAAAAFQNF